MEGSALNKDQEIAGSAAALFGDSSSPFDAFSTARQDNQSAALFFDRLANEQASQIQQTTTDYSPYYGYKHNSDMLQESTYGTAANTTGDQQYSSTTSYNYYGGQYNTNDFTEGMNSSIDPQTTDIQYQYSDYTGYSYDATNGQDYSQYYNYSQQQQYYDPSDPSYAYYYYNDPSAYYQSNENNYQNHTQGSISAEQYQNPVQEISDQTNSGHYEQKEIVVNNAQMDSDGKVNKNLHDESKQNIDDALNPEAKLADFPPKTDLDNFMNNNKNPPHDDEEIKEVSQEIVGEHLQISSSNKLTSLNNEDVAAVAFVETIETNQKGTLSMVSSSEMGSDSVKNDGELNGLENEDQEVNIIHGYDHDIFEYQPQELENNPKSELPHVEPPVSSIVDKSKVTSEISPASETEEINDKPKNEPTKLDDLDDLVLGSTNKPGTSEVSTYAELEDSTKQDRLSISAQDSDSAVSSYRYDYSGQDYQYNYGDGQWNTNDANYSYQEYDVNQTIGITSTSTEQTGHQYNGNDQTTRDIITEIGHKYEPVAVSTTEEQFKYQYSNGTGVDVNKTDYQFPAFDSSKMAEESSSAVYQNNFQYSGSESNRSTVMSDITCQGYDLSVDTIVEEKQSDCQYQAYEASRATVDNKDMKNKPNYQINYQMGSDQTNYSYQEYEIRQADTKAGANKSNYQYYQEHQATTTYNHSQNSPPSISPSPKGSGLISCQDPQCGGENKVTAKFCSDCGKPINSIVSAINVSEVTSNANIYNNNSNDYSFPYSHSQASYSSSSFTSYGNHPTSVNDTQYLKRDPGVVLDTHQLGQQQYYGGDDMNTVNDPLGRLKGCRPIIAFGFGGKIYTMFPRTVQRFTSTDQNAPITKSAPSSFTVRFLRDIIPLSDINDFPGPLLMDNNRGGIKAKKKNVLKYINDQIQIIENSISTFNDEEVEKERLEAIFLVWNLFKIMLENEGALVGSPKVEELVRKTLVPSASNNSNDEANFTIPADAEFDTQQGLSQTPEASLYTYSVSIKSVDKLQELLLKGDRVAAIHHAMNENLWTHALIIASHVNKDLWKEVVIGFIKHEMGIQEEDESNGRESLRVLYSLFAGQGQYAAKEFLPYSNLLNRVIQSPVTAMIPTSHYSANPNVPYVASKVSSHSALSKHNAPFSSLKKWRETIVMILANRAPGSDQAISALGDVLKEYGWIHASHICYILSPNTSIISGFDDLNVRFTLLGNNLSINNFCDYQSFRMTEIYEFGLSLNNNDSGLPHLQAYKLLYAWLLADFGYLNEARRYCESIANIVKVYTKGSPYFHGCFLQKLKDLTQRLLEHGGNSNGTNESSSWLFAKKMPKATLDSLWGSLEGKFNKFVAGDVIDENVKKTSSTGISETIGPFSHFSSITHPTSEVPSRSVSASDFRSVPNPTINLRRATTPNAAVQKQLNENKRRSSTPGVGVQSGLIDSRYNETFSPTTSDSHNTMSSVPEGESLETYPSDGKNDYYSHFTGQDQQHSGSYGYSSYKRYDYNQQTAMDDGNSNSYSYSSGTNEQQSQLSYNHSPLSDYSGAGVNNKQKQQNVYTYYQPSEANYKNDSAWWNNTNSDFNDTTEYQKVDQTQTDDIGEGEFISLMDNNFSPFIPAPAPAVAPIKDHANHSLDEDYDDLGLGNNAFGSKKKIDQTTNNLNTNNSNETNNDTSQTEQKQEEKHEEQKAEEKIGWFGRWFGKKEDSKTANLGEESSFYFDPIQKKWINKKASSESNNASVPSPPPLQRSKTTSPLPSRSIMNSNNNRQSLPPIDDKNLTEPPSSATPPPSNKGGRASSASMKRGVRRYVDIMNQPSLN